MNESLLDAALDYASRGWRVVPLHELVAPGQCSCGNKKCGNSTGKHPRLPEWQSIASINEEILTAWWEQWPNANVGVVFGKDSGIIDIECDSPDIEKSLSSLFDNQFPVCPTFTSGRGKHRIFKWMADLPAQEKALFKIDKIEFRTGNGAGAQSVFPPSTHHSGKQYRWLVHPDEVDPPEIPTRVMDRIYAAMGVERDTDTSKRTPEEWQKLIDGVGDGERNTTATVLAGKYLRMIDVHDNEAVRLTYAMILKWNAGNKPPSDEVELRRTFESILNRERIRRTNDEFEEAMSKFVDTSDPGKPQENLRPVGEWRLAIVESKPQTYKLFSPIWSEKADGGFIELTSSQFKNVEAIRREALEQAKVWLERDFNTIWNGTKKKKGLAAQLIESATVEDAPTEEHRDRWIASVLFEELSRANEFDPDKGNTGSPQRLADGSVQFNFERIHERNKYGAEGIKRNELSKIVRMAGGVDIRPHQKNGRRIKLKRLSPVAMEALEWMATGNWSPDGQGPLRDSVTTLKVVTE